MWADLDTLGSTQDQIDPNRVEWKNDKALLGLLQNTGIKQCVYVAVYRFYVAVYVARRLTDRHWSGATQRSDQFPSLRGQ